MLSHIFLEAFSYVALPKHVKTNNGPTYVSHGLAKFLFDWSISHSTVIPYNSQCQAIIEHTHYTLKKYVI